MQIVNCFINQGYKFLMIFPLSVTMISIFPAMALTPKQLQQFQTEYMQGCLAGMAAEQVSTQRGQAFCECTLDRLSKLPETQLLALGNHRSQKEIMENRDFQIAVVQCSSTLIKD